MHSATAAPDRRHDLDWLRALAILALLFFHAAMPFVTEWGWHIKNAERSSLLLELNFFVSRFRMALLFVIAGVATQFALRRRTIRAFLGDRVKRLLVPLVFGMLVIVPPQVYAERLVAGETSASFLAFWPRTLALRPYPAGDTSYHHLWFILYLFIYAAMLAPALAWCRTPRGSAALARVRSVMARHGIHWLAVPIALAYATLTPYFSGAQNIVDDGAMFVVYFLYFVAGWLVGTDAAVWARITARRRGALTVAVLCLVLIDGIRWNDASPAGLTAASFLWRVLLAVHAWSWVLALLGYGRRWLNRDHPVLRWAREASYPFYILHQTVIVVIAFHVVRTDEPVFVKFLFTSLVSLAVTLAIYETLVRPYAPVRWLFGMAPPRDRGVNMTERPVLGDRATGQEPQSP